MTLSHSIKRILYVNVTIFQWLALQLHPTRTCPSHPMIPQSSMTFVMCKKVTDKKMAPKKRPISASHFSKDSSNFYSWCENHCRKWSFFDCNKHLIIFRACLHQFWRKNNLFWNDKVKQPFCTEFYVDSSSIIPSKQCATICGSNTSKLQTFIWF